MGRLIGGDIEIRLGFKIQDLDPFPLLMNLSLSICFTENKLNYNAKAPV